MKKTLFLGITSVILLTGCSTTKQEVINTTDKVIKTTVEYGESFVNYALKNTNQLISEIFNIDLVKETKKKLDIKEQNEGFIEMKIFEQHNEYNNQIKTMEDIKKRLYAELSEDIKKKITIKEHEVLGMKKYNKDEIKMFFNKLRNETMEIVLQTIEIERGKIEYKPNGILFTINIDKNLLEKNFVDFINYKMEVVQTNRFEMY